jgi:hypothetical protein
MKREVPTCLVSTPAMKAAAEHVKNVLDSQRQTTTHLLEDLRYLLLKDSDLIFKHRTNDIERRLRQIERALEFYRSAEARIEILISHLEGRV